MKREVNQVTRESPYLFPNPKSGEPFQQIFYSWNKARKAANIDTVRMHDLRHSFASALVNSGMTLYDVKEILGHTNIKTTERYAHLSNSRLRQAAESVTTFYENQDWIGQVEGLAREKDEEIKLEPPSPP
jgi:site-specific recombinase XerD